MEQLLSDETAKSNQALRTWQAFMERLYHEDDLMNQRMYHFWTVQAFLAAALALGNYAGNYGGGSTDIQYLVALFGFTLALLYIPLGLGYVRGIQCLHEYLRYLESYPGVPKLVEGSASFLRRGSVEIEQGVRIALSGKWSKRPIYGVFPWYSGLSASRFIGVGTPVLATIFWLLVLAALHRWLGHIDRIVPGLTAFLIAVFAINFGLGRLIPGRPQLERSNDTDKKGVA
jgi:hypothetical protein